MRQEKLEAIHAVWLGMCRSQALDPVLCGRSGDNSVYIKVQINGKTYRVNITQMKGE